MSRHLRVLPCALALLVLGACAASASRQLTKFKDQVAEANQLVQHDEYARADAILKGVLAADSFPKAAIARVGRVAHYPIDREEY